MIVEAIDKRTKRIVKIKEAYSGQRCMCLHCGAEMYPVLAVKSPFFRCYDGEKHTNYLCEQLERTNRAYDPQLTDIAQLFGNLFKPVREKKDPPWGPEEDKNPDVFDPENGDLQEDDSERDTEGDADSDEAEGEAEEEKEKEEEEEGEEDEDEPSEPLILPCRTLSQLWKAGIYKLRPSDRIGSCLRSDIFLWFKDFDKFFARRVDLGKRVLAVRPLWPVNRANAILFTSFSSIRRSNESKIEAKPEHKQKYLVLAFQNRKEYNQACKKLFIRNTGNSGASSTAPKYDMVLVAGDWAELDEEESTGFVKPGENNCGVQSSPFFSKNQIYPIPKQKIKK